MKILGEWEDSLNMTLCSKFKPTLLEGHLCFTLNLNLIETGKTRAGKKAGLALVIDEGIQKAVAPGTEGVIEDSESPLDITEDSYTDITSARIYLNTLSSFSDYRAGSYAMFSPKKMTGTESFLKQTDNARKCLISSLEDCQARLFLEIVQEKCGCVPWTVTLALQSQVFLFKSNIG